ncbi:reverse transcriptase domain-containing protein [Tanacetum coccineum]
METRDSLQSCLLSIFTCSTKEVVKDPVEIHNIQKRDEESSGVHWNDKGWETRRMKGAPECMRISRFMHGVNKPELTKRLNEHVPKTMEEMMITTIAFIQGETAAGGKKKGHASSFYKSMDEFHDRKPTGLISSVDEGIVTIRSTILIPDECATVITSSKEIPKEVGVRHENFKVALHPNFLDHEVVIRGTLSAKERTELCSLLKKNLDIFAWQPSDMTDVHDQLVDTSTQYFKKGYSPCSTKKWGQARMLSLFFSMVQKPSKRRLSPDTDGRVRRRDNGFPYQPREAKMLRDIDETFRTLRKINMKLNPKKCTFGAAEGMFLGYMVLPEGIKPCPSKTEAVLQLSSPRIIKEKASTPNGLAPNQRNGKEEVSGTKWIGGDKGTEAEGVSPLSNNEAEYDGTALIAGLRITTQIGVRNVHVNVDSKLVANQVLGAYVAKEENMIKYLEKVKSLVSGFTNFSISQVPRSKNKKADALSKIASTSFAHLSKQVLVEILKEKFIQEKEVTTVVEEDGLTWMTPIIEYLKEGTHPEDKKEASKLRIKARQYELWEGVLYRRSFLKPWLRCIGPLQADYVI